MKSEHTIQNEIRVALSGEGHTVFRANVGKVKTADGRWFDTGLPKGHPDLYGFRPDGRIFYIEVKNEKGRVRPEQETFIKIVKARGVIAGVARSVADALKIVSEGDKIDGGKNTLGQGKNAIHTKIEGNNDE